ncbi:unnamed protein product [Diatraea saccharalis]|uniref:Uncharacterized protein n=1 Tax=Diatraea saccharalis TaxID=40085 RepID=A0A9P0G0B1_9NEOP|nr:unnamed protein product [Diatraea saccharalis]
MSDSSEDEDLSRFREAVDSTFTQLIDQSRGKKQIDHKCDINAKTKSERYLEVASHYNDVIVPAELQKKIATKISAIIDKQVEFVNIEYVKTKKRKIKGGIKLFKDSENYLSWVEAKDTFTEEHNAEAKKMKRAKRKIEDGDLTPIDKIKAAVLSSEHILSKEEIKCWKSRRKEKLYKYKKNGNGNLLTLIE